jgi:type VI secretion system protein ImpF
MPGPDVALLPSVLDRLLDDNVDAAQASSRSRVQQLLELRNAIKRDLEALLNTRRCCRTPPAEFTELEQSLLRYGVPDFLTVNAGAAAAREEFRLAVEEIIQRFEPRFKTVKVSLVDDGTYSDRALRFHIEALVHAEPAPERVSFDSMLDPASHSFSVLGSRND